jgi:voltage-gated potassium channel
MFERISLRRIVQKQDHLAGWAFDLTIQALIVLSIIAFCVETLPNLPPLLSDALWYFEVVTVSIFTVEYGLRAYYTQPTSNYTLSFYGFIDLAAILPFYITTGLDLRSARVFRLLRVFRVVKLLRYTKALNRFRRAFLRVREEFIIFLLICMLIMFFASVGIYYFEKPAQPEAFKSIFHSMWWAVATLTTVGYGDVYPVTMGGKFFTFIILMLGLGVVSVPAGLLASALTEVFEEEGESKTDQQA